MTDKPKIDIDIVSDVVCPWCYLGGRSLAAALREVPEVEANVRWRPFQLDPSIPPGGIDRDEYMRRKFGSTERLAGAHRHLEERGREVGIDYAFSQIKRSPNTLDAHRLLRWAGEAGQQNEIAEALFARYFEKGEDIGNHGILAAVAAEAGMDAATVQSDLAGDKDRAEVEAEIANAARAGISGVPFFIFAGKYGVSGAQPVETLANVIRQVLEKEHAGAAA